MKRFSNYSLLSVWFIFVFIIYVHFNLQLWETPKSIISWDIKSYYAYFPAVIIEKDFSLSFLDKEDYPHKNFFWNNRTEDNDRIILTSCGLAMMYSPFTMLAHILAPSFGFEQSGFSPPYALAIVFSNFIFLLIGIIFLRKILKKYFSDLVAAFGILGVLFGTNLYFYSTFEPAMPHTFNFTLTVAFLYFVIKWYESPKLWMAVLIGIIGGLVSLVRPNNIFVLLLLVFWGVGSLSDIKDRIFYLLKKWHLVLIMAASFILVWIPQFLYWYAVTGKLFYYSYGVSGGVFYFENPQFLNQLFAYRCGVLLYSPLLIFAFLGLPLLLKKKEGLFLPVILYLTATYYLLSSWWSWWNGGSFGVRSYIDSYGILIFGLSAFVSMVLKSRKWIRIPMIIVISFFIAYGSFTSYQYSRAAIHFDSNSKEMYWKGLFKLRPYKTFYQDAKMHKPDYFLARCGIYEFKSTSFENDESLRACIVNEIRAIENDKVLFNSFKEQANAQEVSVYRLIRSTVENNCKQKFIEE